MIGSSAPLSLPYFPERFSSIQIWCIHVVMSVHKTLYECTHKTLYGSGHMKVLHYLKLGPRW